MNKIFKRTVLGILFLIQIYILINFFFMHHFQSAMFDSDAASEILLAKQLVDNPYFGIFSDNWFYSTEIRVLHNQLIFAPLYAIFRNYKIAYASGACLIMMLFAIVIVFFLRSLKVEWLNCWVGLLLFLIPYGSYHRYSVFSVFWGNSYYSFFLIFSFLFLGGYFRINSAGLFLKRCLMCILVIISFIMGCCGIRYALLILVPLLAWRLFLWYRQFSKVNALDTFLQCIKPTIEKLFHFTLAIFFFLGYLIYNYAIRRNLGGAKTIMVSY